MLDSLLKHWYGLGIATSLFWAIRGAYLFTYREDAALGESQKAAPGESQAKLKYVFRESFPKFMYVATGGYQFILNFAGSFAGWVCVAALAMRLKAQTPSLAQLGWSDGILFLAALIGVTGHLPSVVVGLGSALGKLADALAGRLVPK